MLFCVSKKMEGGVGKFDQTKIDQLKNKKNTKLWPMKIILQGANKNHNRLKVSPWNILLLTSIGLVYIIFSAVLNNWALVHQFFITI